MKGEDKDRTRDNEDEREDKDRTRDNEDEREHGPSLAEIETIRIPRAELRRILDENARLYEQVKETQTANAELIEERRRTKATDRARMVRDFLANATPWQERLERPGVPSASTVRFRVRLVLDEVIELLDEIYDDRAAVDQLRHVFGWFLDQSNYRKDLYTGSERFARVVHEAGDIAYTVEGLLATFGVDGTRVFCRIHEANMNKAGADRDASGKLGKPEGWTPADIAAELREQRGDTSKSTEPPPSKQASKPCAVCKAPAVAYIFRRRFDGELHPAKYCREHFIQPDEFGFMGSVVGVATTDLDEAIAAVGGKDNGRVRFDPRDGDVVQFLFGKSLL